MVPKFSTSEKLRRQVATVFLATAVFMTIFTHPAIGRDAQPSKIKISVPDASVFLGAFGAEETSDGKISFHQNASKTTPMLNNFLILNGLDTAVRVLMYQAESCGARAFQFISITSKPDRETLNVIYSCDGSCDGILEKTDSKQKNISDRRVLPKLFCEALWGGGIKLEDAAGL